MTVKKKKKTPHHCARNQFKMLAQSFLNEIELMKLNAVLAQKNMYDKYLCGQHFRSNIYLPYKPI